MVLGSALASALIPAPAANNAISYVALPLGAGRASMMRVGPQGFALGVTHPGRFLVRLDFTQYWSIARGSGCLPRGGK